MKGPVPLGDDYRFWRLVAEEAGCWEWQGKRLKTGYGQFRRNAPRRMELAHRVAWELIHGPVPEGSFICHRCDNPPCCRPSHLFLGTAQDNSDDMVKKGRRKRILTDEQIQEICSSSEPSRAIAPRYGITHAYVRRLRRGEKRSVK